MNTRLWVRKCVRAPNASVWIKFCYVNTYSTLMCSASGDNEANKQYFGGISSHLIYGNASYLFLMAKVEECIPPEDLSPCSLTFYMNNEILSGKSTKDRDSWAAWTHYVVLLLVFLLDFISLKVSVCYWRILKSLSTTGWLPPLS